MSQATWYQRVARTGYRLTLDQRHYERGLAYYDHQKIDLALADLDKAIELAPRVAEYYSARGLMLLDYNAPEEAEDDFAHSLALDPTQWLAHYGRGIQAFRSADYDGAINHFSRAQYVAPQRSEIYIYRAVAFYQNRNEAEATADMQFALTLLTPDDPRRTVVSQWISTFAAKN